MLTSSDFLQGFIFFLISYYFVRKASTLLESNEKIMTFLKLIMGIAFFVFVAVQIWTFE